jgi:hypothetical protein
MRNTKHYTVPSKKQGLMSHCDLAIYIKKYHKVKVESWKLKYFTMQKYNPQKKPSKRNQNPSDIITL